MQESKLEPHTAVNELFLLSCVLRSFMHPALCDKCKKWPHCTWAHFILCVSTDYVGGFCIVIAFDLLWSNDMGRRKPHQCVVCSRVAAGAPNQTQLFCCDPYQLCWHTLLAYCNRTYNSWLCTTANVVLVVFCWRKLSLPRLGAFFRKLFQYFRNVIIQEKFLL